MRTVMVINGQKTPNLKVSSQALKGNLIPIELMPVLGQSPSHKL